MKKVCLLGIFLCLNFMLYSETLTKVIDVEYKDNTIASVVLSPDLTMKFVDNALVFESADSNNSFALADISGFRYTKRVVSSVDEVAGKSFIVTADELQIAGLPEGTVVRVYDLKGVVVAESRVDGLFRLELAQLPDGVYVVNYRDVSRKIMVNKRG